ncbi:MAG: DUF3791 domain-containing protein [Solobacterium sp.]|nr:DUF3791 domain-containing protein [Solobacterium sp.]
MENKLEYIIFCIENIASSLNTDATVIYDELAKKSNILYSYVIPNYEILHTQGKDYIVNDVIDVMRKRGLNV